VEKVEKTKELDQARSTVKIDASGLHYRQVNTLLREAVSNGVDRIELHNVYGQRYLGTDLHRPVEIHIHGTPGNDLASFMDGPRIVVHGNAQDGCGNTMNDGEVIVHGRGGDAMGHSMRGGKIFVRDDVGYRVAIHMKEYQDIRPAVVIGGTAQHFLGEYMAGGVLIVLGLTLRPDERHTANFIGTGMHGGVMYIRGELADYQLGKEVGQVPLEDADRQLLGELVEEYAAHFARDPEAILGRPFTKLIPLSRRPYGRLYAY
jgi:glutamate synthase domain-containing protein 3